MITRIPPQLRAIAASVAAVAGAELVPDAQPIIVALWLCGALLDWVLTHSPDADKTGVPDWIEQRAPGLGALLVEAVRSGLAHDVKQFIRLQLATRREVDAVRALSAGGVLLALLLAGCGAGALRVAADDAVCGATIDGVRVEVVDGLVCVSTLGIRVCEEVAP